MKHTAHQTRASQRGAAAKQRAEELLRGVQGQAANERALHLRPRLINGNTILSDGTNREVQPDPWGGYIAKYAVGEFWELNDDFEPVKRADWRAVARAGFHWPWAPEERETMKQKAGV